VSPLTEPSVELLSFEAEPGASDAKGSARLTWTTRAETRLRGFLLQRRREENGEDGAAGDEAWKKVAFVESKTFGDASTGEGSSDYARRVEGLGYGTHIFRLVQRDDRYDEKPLERRATVEIGLAGRYALSEVYPNPVRGGDEAILDVSVRETQSVTVALYDARGRRVRVLYEGTMPGQQTEPVRVKTEGLASGMYAVRVAGEDFAEMRRLVLVR